LKRIVLLTGARGVGKTTVCCRTVERAWAAGWDCAGLLTLTVDQERRDVLDVRGGCWCRLTTAGAGVRQGRYTFDAAVLAWGARTLVQAVPCDLLVVDELGPLEVERGEGWAVAFDVLAGGLFRLALVVVRLELLELVRGRLPAAQVVTVTRENRDGLPAGLLY